MKIKQTLLYLLAFVMLTSLTISLNAQVTMGSNEAPATGALLQLKNIDQIAGETVNANKGLAMPRVMLTSIVNLFPMFPANYNKAEQDAIHTGLIVYNVNENLPDGDGIGMYVWDGEKWLGVGTKKNTILAVPSLLFISEKKPTGSTVLTVPDGSSWTMSATSGPNSSTHTTSGNNVTFRTVAGTYGDMTYTFSLDNSDKQTNVEVKHIHLAINNPELKMGDNVTISNSSAVEAFGGDANWVVTGYTTTGFNWIAAPQNVGGSLNFQLGAATAQNLDIEGIITVAHVNDPAYTKTIKIIQNSNFISLPEFDFLLVQYRFDHEISGVIDIDITTTVNGTNNANVDFAASGYGFGKQSGKILNWPGDNKTSGFEATYANVPMVLGLLGDDAPKIFNIDMYAHWYMETSDYLTQLENVTPKRNTITISITLYKGGQMTTMPPPNELDYHNIPLNGVPGVKVFQLDVPNIPITTSGVVLPGGEAMFTRYWQNYTPAFRLEFDRIEKTGVIINEFTPVPVP